MSVLPDGGGVAAPLDHADEAAGLDPRTITAAAPLPDDLRYALEAINHPGRARS